MESAERQLKQVEVGAAVSNPFGAAASAAFGGGASLVSVSLIELPRLALTFDAVKQSDGSVRFYSREHPGHYMCEPTGERVPHLLRGLPHALTLVNEEGDPFVLLSAIAKPCRLRCALTSYALTYHAPRSPYPTRA